MIDCLDRWFRPLLIYVQEGKGAYSRRDMPLREWPLRDVGPFDKGNRLMTKLINYYRN